jgi:hypothetical protein
MHIGFFATFVVMTLEKGADYLAVKDTYIIRVQRGSVRVHADVAQ